MAGMARTVTKYQRLRREKKFLLREESRNFVMGSLKVS